MASVSHICKGLNEHNKARDEEGETLYKIRAGYTGGWRFDIGSQALLIDNCPFCGEVLAKEKEMAKEYHNHQPECKHSMVRYCPLCKVCYCPECGKEWNDIVYYTPYTPQYPWTIDNPWTVGDSGGNWTVSGTSKCH